MHLSLVSEKQRKLLQKLKSFKSSETDFFLIALLLFINNFVVIRFILYFCENIE